ncbi:acetyltransferase domain-containing protein [Biscogniauxia mediterranea]|nr:acetyltransferase domain-containing protein [Biscogniauxia mediterranea]
MTTTTPDADKPVPPPPPPPAPAAQITATATATATAEPKRVRVRTTLPALPLPPSASRPPIRTARLVLRPASAADLAAVHALRAQPAVMARTAAGRPDRDLQETRAFLDRFLPPRDADTFNFVVLLLREDGEGEGEGELIGTGGMHRIGSGEGSGSKTGWPEVGYLFKQRHWGRGYATEFLRACVDAWWALPREERELEVDEASVAGLGWDDGAGGDGEVRRVPERVTAMVEEGNPNSANVLRKVGFAEFKRWTEPDSREGCGQRDVTLIALSATAPPGR